MYKEQKHNFKKLNYEEKEEYLSNLSFEQLEDFYIYEIDRCNNNKKGDFSEDDRDIIEEAILLNYNY